MGSKKKTSAAPIHKEAVHVRFVARAGMWCTTRISGGKQTQTWTIEKPDHNPA